MGRVGVELTMSVDGFIAGPNDGPEHPLGEGGEALFTWFDAGDTDFKVPSGTMTFRVSRASAALFERTWPTYGALISGRRTFDIAQGWGGRHPLNVPIFVVSHQPRPAWSAGLPNITWVSDGLPSAIAQAQAVAGGKNVSVNAASLAQQALAAGLLDDIQIDLVPVMLGSGVRFWGEGGQPVGLEQLEPVVGTGVTHLRYRVLK